MSGTEAGAGRGAGPEVVVRGYRLALDRAYDPVSHLWVLGLEDGGVRVGLDPLGVEANGTLAELSLRPPGTEVRRGEPLGELEAAKFVGPIPAPVSGVVRAVNAAAVLDPGLVEGDPLGAGWLVELTPRSPQAELAELLSGAEAVVPWFEAEVDAYRRMGVLAE